MAVNVRQWKGAWWIFINHHGMRKAKRVGVGEPGRKAAKLAAQQIQARLALGQAAFSSDKAGVTIDEYAATFLQRIEQTRKHTTYADYQKILNRDILPVLHGLDLQDVTREKVKGLAMECLRKGQGPKTVQNIMRCLSSLFSHAVEDQLVAVNPAIKPGKFLPKVGKRHKITPLTREEVAQLLETARRSCRGTFRCFSVRSGPAYGWGSSWRSSGRILIGRGGLSRCDGTTRIGK
jgi:integrase